MTYNYELLDNDVGGKVDHGEGFSMPAIVKTIQDLDYDFEDEMIELTDDPDALRADIEKWDINAVVDSFMSFKFASGCCWSVELPGGHRELRVRRAV